MRFQVLSSVPSHTRASRWLDADRGPGRRNAPIPDLATDEAVFKANVKLDWHGPAEQVVDLATESIRDVRQLPGVPAARK
jgi:hypothetical protein